MRTAYAVNRLNSSEVVATPPVGYCSPQVCGMEVVGSEGGNLHGWPFSGTGGELSNDCFKLCSRIRTDIIFEQLRTSHSESVDGMLEFSVGVLKNKCSPVVASCGV